ncbi:cycloheximide resistance protein [Xylariaceae sp. FL1651]|nr:cycloheximide resistance protein [Xylariaceae sp. FL1651]
MGNWKDFFRDTTAGHLWRLALGPESLPYPEEKPGYQPRAIPEKSSLPVTPLGSTQDAEAPSSGLSSDDTIDITEVGWYGVHDTDCPHNWSTLKKSLVFAEISLLTFAIYIGSSIVTTAEPTFIKIFSVSQQVSSLSLSLYVLGYGIGPLFFSPLSEIPHLGRNFVYTLSLVLFIAVSIAAALVDNFAGFLVVRFLQGFLGSPVLATGGASAADLFGFHKLYYRLSAWQSAAFAGPAIGPVISGYAVLQATWRWTMYELLILGGFTFIVIVFCLPETNADTILLRRARRLRKVTGNEALRSESERRQENILFIGLLGKYLSTPLKVTIQDPSIAFINIYTALIYAIYYSYFESFPLVYQGIYNFSLGSLGIIFTALLIACGIGAAVYLVVVYLIYEPYTVKNGVGVPEYRLVPGIWTAALAPVGVLIFGLTARPNIHWAVPTLGVLIYSASQFVLGGVIFFYLATAYPRYAASLFAGNTFLRSALAAGAVHFSQPLFGNLGIMRGCGVLAGLLVACFFGITALWHFGAQLRARSKFAETY